jgi:hypothetical protein
MKIRNLSFLGCAAIILPIAHPQHQFQFEKAGINSTASRRLDSRQTLRRYTKKYTAICLHSAYTAAR